MGVWVSVPVCECGAAAADRNQEPKLGYGENERSNLPAKRRHVGLLKPRLHQLPVQVGLVGRVRLDHTGDVRASEDDAVP
eukprot:100967-Alexandrium_andersonii.AAC.1